MTPEKRKAAGRRRPRAPWAEIRTDYEVTGLGFGKLARKYGQRENTIRLRAKREKWGPRESASVEATRQAIEDFVSRKRDALLAVLGDHVEAGNIGVRIALRRLKQIQRKKTLSHEESVELSRLSLQMDRWTKILRRTAGLKDELPTELRGEGVTAIRFEYDQEGDAAMERRAERRLKLVKGEDEDVA